MSKLTLDLQKLLRDLKPLVSHLPQQTGYTRANSATLERTGSQEATSENEDAFAYDAVSIAERITKAVAETVDLDSPSYADLITNGITLENTRYKLRDYQADGIRFLQARKRAFLVDKPGLGKTIQAICAAKLPVIIFCPTYLTYNWFNVLNEVALPVGHTVVLAAGPKQARLAALAQCADWTICNIEMLRDYEDYFPEAATLIIDEAHHIRGKDSQQSLAAMKLSLKCENVFLLTATPVYNKPDDLYAQFRLLDHENFHSYWQFINRHCIMVQMAFGPKILGARPSLKVEFDKLSLGRTYQDVALELPDLISDTIIVDPPDDFKKLYADLKYRYFVPGREVYENALQVLQALRKITAPQKLKPLLSLITDTDALTGTVIFSYYKESAEQIGALLDIPVITGDMSPKERLKVAKNAKCISATISSMSEGVDLSHLHTVIFFELGYVPGQIYQALSRVRRHGGAAIVHVYYLLVKNTVDQVLYSVRESRTATINSIVRESLE